MPVEKLTKKRLIQILIMLTILLSAFAYQTYQHYQTHPQGELGSQTQSEPR